MKINPAWSEFVHSAPRSGGSLDLNWKIGKAGKEMAARAPSHCRIEPKRTKELEKITPPSWRGCTGLGCRCVVRQQVAEHALVAEEEVAGDAEMVRFGVGDLAQA
jgi:hypothetical protein